MINNNKNPKKFKVSPNIAEQLKKGNKIEAIKLLREENGIGLKEAKELIDNILDNKTLPEVNTQTQENYSMSYNVLNHLRAGKKIDAIKALRQETGLGLKDAKDAVEKVLLENPEVKLRYDAEAKRGVISFLSFAAVVILIVLLIYYFFKF
jgi:ribosomal protein L7/L12